MKISFFLIFIALLSLSVFAQKEQEQEVRLSSKEFKKRIIQEVFPDVPESVRNCHAQGMLRVRVVVNEEGSVKKVNLVSGLCMSANEYVIKTVADWKFKPLKINGEKVSFRSVYEIPFCYGGFGSCY